MRRIITLLLLMSSGYAAQAMPAPAGRWIGQAQIPGRDMQLVVDLAETPSGAWIGSLIVPGFGIKGTPLGNVAVAGDEVSFDAGSALGTAPDGLATFKARIGASGTMQGEMRQAGNAARFELHRAGPAQVEAAPQSTPVPRAIEGSWVGEYQFGGYPRHVTVNLQNHDGAAATAEFVIVGKATTKLPIDRVSEIEGNLRIECHAYGIHFEGRIASEFTAIDGSFQQGPFELPLVLRRPAGRNS